MIISNRMEHDTRLQPQVSESILLHLGCCVPHQIPAILRTISTRMANGHIPWKMMLLLKMDEHRSFMELPVWCESHCNWCTMEMPREQWEQWGEPTSCWDGISIQRRKIREKGLRWLVKTTDHLLIRVNSDHDRFWSWWYLSQPMIVAQTHFFLGGLLIPFLSFIFSRLPFVNFTYHGKSLFFRSTHNIICKSTTFQSYVKLQEPNDQWSFSTKSNCLANPKLNGWQLQCVSLLKLAPPGVQINSSHGGSMGNSWSGQLGPAIWEMGHWSSSLCWFCQRVSPLFYHLIIFKMIKWWYKHVFTIWSSHGFTI